MADEEKIVEEKVEEKKGSEIKEEPKEKIEEKSQVFDNSAIEELRGKIEDVEKKGAEDRARLESAKKAILGEDATVKEEEEFYKKLSTMPKEAIEDLIRKTTEPIKKSFEEKERQREIQERDRLAFMNLRTTYPDFDVVMKDVPKYLSKEEMGQAENLPNRVEYIFSLTKGRREIDLGSKKVQETNAMNAAKEESNKTAKTEIPTGGGTMETVPEEDELDSRIKKRREEGNWSKGEGFTKQDEDIFEKYQRDVYRIKRK